MTTIKDIWILQANADRMNLYKHFKTIDDFGNFLAHKLKKYTYLRANFAVDFSDIPGKPKLSPKCLKETYEAMTGIYGVRTENPFDNDSLIILAGYHGAEFSPKPIVYRPDDPVESVAQSITNALCYALVSNGDTIDPELGLVAVF